MPYGNRTVKKQHADGVLPARAGPSRTIMFAKGKHANDPVRVTMKKCPLLLQEAFIPSILSVSARP